MQSLVELHKELHAKTQAVLGGKEMHKMEVTGYRKLQTS
jgi:hypothetical protein